MGKSPNDPSVLLINSEEDAWELLRKLLDHDSDTPIPTDIAFGEWAVFKAYFKGEKFDSSLTPSLFPLYIELQRQIRSTYSLLKYDSRNKKLSKAEKEKLEICINIREGSSDTLTGIDFQRILEGFAQKMDGKQIFKLCVIIVLSWCGKTCYESYLKTVSEENRQKFYLEQQKETNEHNLEMQSQHENEIVNIISMINNDPKLHNIYRESEKLQHEKLKAATKSEKSTISGVTLEKSQAQELLKTSRSKPVPKRIDGTFEILSLDWDNYTDQDTRYAEIKLKRITDGLVFKARFSDESLSTESLDALKASEWNMETAKLIDAEINARVLRNEVLDAEIMTVKESHSKSIEK
jgi:hypothetical protein